MSRIRRERVDRLIRSFQGDPEVRVTLAPEIFELAAGRPLSAAEVAQLAQLDLPEQWARLQLLRQSTRAPSEGTGSLELRAPTTTADQS